MSRIVGTAHFAWSDLTGSREAEGLRLSVVNLAASADGGEPRPSCGRDEIKVSDQTVMSIAVRQGRPFLAEHPASLRLQLGRDETGLFEQHPEERAWVGLPLLAAGAPIGALRFSFTRPGRSPRGSGSSWRPWPASAR